ncbi:MAG: hypothetical protein FWD42_05995, partial [Solirubrobacterales bacterium]|nr:hypothetical protein [Solirubrobacterales bacterium]
MPLSLPLWKTLVTASALVALAWAPMLVWAERSSATAAEPYGEVSHFGGFATGEVSGKFDIPVGFAV